MNPNHTDKTTGVILAGGRSSRFGENKALASWEEGRTLLESVVYRLKPLFDEALIIVKDVDLYKNLVDDKTRILKDQFVDFHSIGGVFSGLKSATNEVVFVCGCDMPFIKPELIKALLSARGDYDAVIPRRNNTLQPLCGVYSKNCLDHLKEMIDAGNYKIIDLLSRVRTLFFEEEDLLRVDPEGRSFLDIDTVEDYKFARGLNFRCTTENSYPENKMN